MTTENITIKGKTYSVAKRGTHGMDLVGAKGARYVLVQNLHHGHWTLIDGSGRALGRFPADAFGPVAQ